MKWNPYAADCPTRQLLDRISDKWVVLVLSLLEDGPKRFSMLKREIDGISQKMLSQTLHALERDGLVHREAQPTNPPRVDYELTELGRGAAERLMGLIRFLEGNTPQVLEARGRYDETRGGR